MKKICRECFRWIPQEIDDRGICKNPILGLMESLPEYSCPAWALNASNHTQEKPPMKDKLSNDDIRAIRYFWEYRKDVTRYMDWENILPILERDHPELLKALHDWEVARQSVTDIVDKLCTLEIDTE